MTTVKNCLDEKPQPTVLVSVSPDDKVVNALQLMRDQRVRAVLVLEAHVLKGIITQGDCAIKVLLPGWNAKQTLLETIMTKNPVTVPPTDELDKCMNTMASRNIRHLPVVSDGKVMGMVSVGDIVKDIIRQQGDQIKQLETYIKGHGVA